MDLKKVVEETIKDSNDLLIKNAKNKDQNSIYELLATARVECYAEYDSDVILSEIKNQLNIKSDEELVNNNDVKYFFGLPVQNESDKVLSFKNPKTDTIHLCRTNEMPENWGNHSDISNKVYGWSVCGFGSSKGKSKNNALYISDSEVEDTYIEREGEIIGKICSNCKNSYQSN